MKSASCFDFKLLKYDRRLLEAFPPISCNTDSRGFLHEEVSPHIFLLFTGLKI